MKALNSASAGAVQRDPILLTILAKALQSASEEMAINLIRSAFSAVVREARDCSTALLDAKGRVVAQAEMIPMQTAALSTSFAAAAEQLNLSDIRPNHAILMNDPYSGGQHLNDLILFSPIFHEDELIGWAGSTAHHLDIGGGSAGVNTTASELIQEGLVIPPILFEVNKHWHGGLVERLIFANIRTPEIGRGDMDAQFAANHLGIRRVCGIAARYGVDTLRAAMEEVMDYSERRMRAAIATIPDGSWDGEAWIDSNGENPPGPPLKIAVRVTICGDEAEIDFTGTTKQLRTMFNSPEASSIASALTALRSILNDTTIPANDGCNRPIKIILPKGSILNPHPGAPVRARATAGCRSLDAVHDALAKILPDAVPAQGSNTTTALFLSHKMHDGKVCIHLDVLGGGWGAANNYDGIHATDHVLSSCRLTPIESIEQLHPYVRMECCELRPNSAGAGEFTGGMGLNRRYRILADDVVLSTYADRYVLPPQGRSGGTEGALARLFVERDGEIIELGAHSTLALKKGDAVEIRLPGGGGWGDPRKRLPELVTADFHNGLISEVQLRDVYGHLLSTRPT
jgi:N-methylhydantoinase B